MSQENSNAAIAQNGLLDAVPNDQLVSFRLEIDLRSLARLLNCLHQHEPDLYLTMKQEFNKVLDELEAR